MSMKKKLLYFFIAGIGVLLALSLTLILFAPRFINSESVRNTIQSAISQKVGGKLGFQQIDLDLFPRPYVVMRNVTLFIPQSITGTFESLSIYPKILPLFSGKVHFAKVEAESPDFTMSLHGIPKKSKGVDKAIPFSAIQDKALQLLSPLALNVPDLKVVVKKGSLDLLMEKETIFSLQDINSSIIFPPGELTVKITSQSNLWKTISIDGSIDPDYLRGKVRVKLTRFKPHLITRFLIPDTIHQIGESVVNIDLGITMDGLQDLQGEVNASLPSLTIIKGGKESVLKVKRLKADFHMSEDKLTADLTEMNLDYPRLNLSGELLIDRKFPSVSLTLNGRAVDVQTTREASLILGGNVPVIKDIFDILRGGTVPSITFETHGSSFADMGKTENILIRGKIREGRIFVPGPQLSLESVKGDAVISQGVLEGKNSEARLGKSLGRNGTLKVGLVGENPPFHLDIIVQTDLEQLLPVLNRFVKNEAFVKELSAVHNLEGTAEGRLILGESLESINVTVDVSEMNLTARYQLLPHPLEIDGGQFFFDETIISIKNLHGKLGSSSFSELTASLSRADLPDFEIKSGKYFIDMEEIYPWLLSFEQIGEVLRDIKAMRGSLALSHIDLKGPLLNPQQWQFTAIGYLEDIFMESTLFPGPVAMRSGKIEALSEKLSFRDVEADIMDASLHASGAINNYMEDIYTSDVTMRGDLGPEATRWVSTLINLPSELAVRSPLSVSEAHLTWNSAGRVSLEGNLTVQEGPSISLDIFRNPEELTIKKLQVNDEESNAFLSLTLKEREFGLNFTGNLTQRTTDKFFMNTLILNEWITGDFKVHILRDEPLKITAEGALQGANIPFSSIMGAPGHIKSFSLNAATDRLTVESAILIWEDNIITLGGDLNFTGDSFLLDMDLSTTEIDLEKIGGLLEKEDTEENEGLNVQIWDIPIRGVLRLKSENFTYDRFTWNPFHANISFARDEVSVEVINALLCGIAFPGVMKVTTQGLSLDFQPNSMNQELEPAFACLLQKERYATGSFGLKGKVAAQGKSETLVRSLRGSFEFSAIKGRIYQYGLLAKIFAFLNLTEIFKGQLPDMVKEGFAYRTITTHGDIKDGRVVVNELIIDSPSMGIVAQGFVDPVNNKVDLKCLVAPLRTVDSIIKKIPGISQLTGGTLFSIPLRVTGDLDNPKITYFSLSAAESGLLGIMKKTITAPIQIIQPLLPGKKKE
jgi:hypothetical protein